VVFRRTRIITATEYYILFITGQLVSHASREDDKDDIERYLIVLHNENDNIIIITYFFKKILKFWRQLVNGVLATLRRVPEWQNNNINTTAWRCVRQCACDNDDGGQRLRWRRHGNARNDEGGRWQLADGMQVPRCSAPVGNRRTRRRHGALDSYDDDRAPKHDAATRTGWTSRDGGGVRYLFRGFGFTLLWCIRSSSEVGV